MAGQGTRITISWKARNRPRAGWWAPRTNASAKAGQLGGSHTGVSLRAVEEDEGLAVLGCVFKKCGSLRATPTPGTRFNGCGLKLPTGSLPTSARCDTWLCKHCASTVCHGTPQHNFRVVRPPLGKWHSPPSPGICLFCLLWACTVMLRLECALREWCLQFLHSQPLLLPTFCLCQPSCSPLSLLRVLAATVQTTRSQLRPCGR